MTDDPLDFRVGDRERDEAVNLLREHHATGRLDVTEFNDRIERALSARTRGELTDLFVDLPGAKPGQAPVQQPFPTNTTPQPWGDSHGSEAQRRQAVLPWYAQWWMLLVAVGINVVLPGRIWWLVPAMAIWIWVIYPSIASRQAVTPPSPGRPLTYEEREAVMYELRNGRKVAAIKVYRQYSGAGLVDAKNAVEAWERGEISGY